MIASLIDNFLVDGKLINAYFEADSDKLFDMIENFCENSDKFIELCNLLDEYNGTQSQETKNTAKYIISIQNLFLDLYEQKIEFNKEKKQLDKIEKEIIKIENVLITSMNLIGDLNEYKCHVANLIEKEELQNFTKRIEMLKQKILQSDVVTKVKEEEQENQLLDEMHQNGIVESTNNFFEDWKNQRRIYNKQELIELLNISTNYEYLADKKLLEDPEVSKILWINKEKNIKKRNNIEPMSNKVEFMKLLQIDVSYFENGSEALKNDDDIIQLVLSIKY